MRVFDCCLFHNELELLELRLHTHRPWAHAHVVVESPRTFSNLPKPIRLNPQAPAFAPFSDTLRHIIADGIPFPQASGKKLGKAARMEINGQQWEQAKLGMADAEPGDMILLSDLDEILRPEAIEQAKSMVARGPVRFNTTLYTYALNGFRAPRWFGPVAGLARDVLKGSLWTYRQSLRNTAEQAIYGAGWHFSSLGTVEQVHEKLRAAAHTEWDRFVGDRKALAEWIKDGHVFSPNNASAGVVKYVPIDDGFPPYLVANQGRFQHMIHRV